MFTRCRSCLFNWVSTVKVCNIIFSWLILISNEFATDLFWSLCSYSRNWRMSPLVAERVGFAETACSLWSKAILLPQRNHFVWTSSLLLLPAHIYFPATVENKKKIAKIGSFSNVTAKLVANTSFPFSLFCQPSSILSTASGFVISSDLPPFS